MKNMVFSKMEGVFLQVWHLRNFEWLFRTSLTPETGLLSANPAAQ